ncbi:MAG: restriction endonuclease subunit S [Chlorobiaceae bacterium]
MDRVMIADLKPYPAYRDSGLPWLGKVPEHWKQRRTKFLFRERVQKGYPDEPLLAATQSKGVVRKEEYGSRTVTATKDLHLLKLVEQGDYVISLRSFEGGIEVAHSRGIISPAYTVLAPQKDASQGYYTHFFKSPDFIRSLTLFVTGIREGQNIDYERLSRAYLPLPPPDEQAAIVRFLGWSNGQLEKAIRAKRKVITLLNEQKQAIIHQAVTRGLDPSVPLKPSGIPWLGDIPQHWETPLNQRVFREQIRPHGDLPELQLSLSQRDGLIATKDMQERSLQTATFDNWKVTLPGDLVLNRFKAHLGVFFASTLRGIVSFHYGVFAPRRELYSKYFELLFHTYPYRTIYAGRSNGMTVGLQNLSNQNFYSVRCLVPPVQEQLEIVAHIERETEALNTAISRFEREIELLREYRTRLVADVATGKLDVREAAAKLPDEVQTLEFEDDLVILEEDVDCSL